MPYKIEFDKRASTELGEIVAWYEKEAPSNVLKFETAFVSAIEVLSKGLIDYASFIDEIKKAPVSGFPYRINYSRKEETKTVYVHAILHTRRNEDFIAGRLKE